LQLKEFQSRIEKIYYKKDKKRGVDSTFRWYVEETGELARALRVGKREFIEAEFADCLAWLLSLASLCDIDIEQAMAKYLEGCPKCMKMPCACPELKGGRR